MARLVTLETNGSKGTMTPKNIITLGVSSTTAITIGAKIQARTVSPFTGIIKKWRITSDLNTSTIVDIWKSVTGTTPTNANSITGTDKPTLIGQQTNSSTLLTGWATTINEGDLLQLEVESNNTSRGLTIQLTIE
jgi:hypothetical protein